MNERERKMLAFLAGIIYDLSRGLPITDGECTQIDNIRSELGYSDLEEDEFRY